MTPKQLDYQYVSIIRNTINTLYSAQRLSGKPLADLVALARTGQRRFACKRVTPDDDPFSTTPTDVHVGIELPDLTLWDKAVTALGLDGEPAHAA